MTKPKMFFPPRDRVSFRLEQFLSSDYENSESIFVKADAYDIKNKEDIQLQIIFSEKLLHQILQNLSQYSRLRRKVLSLLKPERRSQKLKW